MFLSILSLLRHNYVILVVIRRYMYMHRYEKSQCSILACILSISIIMLHVNLAQIRLITVYTLLKLSLVRR